MDGDAGESFDLAEIFFEQPAETGQGNAVGAPGFGVKPVAECEEFPEG